MKIDKPDRKERIRFGKLPVGECFWDEDKTISRLCMKTSNQGNPCAVSLESGNIYFFQDDTEVVTARNVRVVIDV